MKVFGAISLRLRVKLKSSPKKYLSYIDTLVSGSPIIQNGKLVGAVTHVFVGDPTGGYGIFAETMPETARGVGQGLVPAEKRKEAS